MKNKGLIIFTALIITILFIDVIHALDKKQSQKQPQKQSQEKKQNVIANEILKSLEGGEECNVIFDGEKAMSRDYHPSSYRTQFNPKDYFLVKNVSINKVGSTVRKREQNLFTKEWEDEYSAPLLITVEGTCTVVPNKGKNLSIKGDEEIILDKWGEWHCRSIFARSKVCSTIYEECKKPAELAVDPRNKAFMAYNNGTVLDTRTGLMWAVTDGGQGRNWQKPTWSNANEYCKDFRAGGYTDWRLPTYAELTDLYNNGLPSYITIYARPWSSDLDGDKAFYFDFKTGKGREEEKSQWLYSSVLPVRSTDKSKRWEEESLKKTQQEQAERESVKRKKQEEEAAEAKRFVKNNDGTRTDTSTGLMWGGQTTMDNVTQEGAESWCKGYRGSGYTDWRLPTTNELDGVYDRTGRYGIRSEGRYWSSDRAACIDLIYGTWQPFTKGTRSCGALPVRSAVNRSVDDRERVLEEAKRQARPCFIATAAYGSVLDPSVILLREFRDDLLLKNKIGQSLVTTYYKFSPPIAQIISKHEILKLGVRIILVPALVFSFMSLKIGLFWTLMFFTLMLIAMPLLIAKAKLY